MNAPIATVCTMHLTPTGAHRHTQQIACPTRADAESLFAAEVARYAGGRSLVVVVLRGAGPTRDVECGPFDAWLPLDAD